jgi:hypothetical protein
VPRWYDAVASPCHLFSHDHDHVAETSRADHYRAPCGNRRIAPLALPQSVRMTVSFRWTIKRETLSQGLPLPSLACLRARHCRRSCLSLRLVFGQPTPSHLSLCYTDTSRGVTYLYPILIGYADTDTQIHHFSGFSFDEVHIRVSDTYCIGYLYPYSCNIDLSCCFAHTSSKLLHRPRRQPLEEAWKEAARRTPAPSSTMPQFAEMFESLHWTLAAMYLCIIG